MKMKIKYVSMCHAQYQYTVYMWLNLRGFTTQNILKLTFCVISMFEVDRVLTIAKFKLDVFWILF